mmetsp:Transcript_50223/g.129293  ORF Transcript_50223/g.129293 Transcript_50223/m.129293 type:complete len:204 (+) Transcript_50223:248-859(+)
MASYLRINILIKPVIESKGGNTVIASCPSILLLFIHCLFITSILLTLTLGMLLLVLFRCCHPTLSSLLFTHIQCSACHIISAISVAHARNVGREASVKKEGRLCKRDLVFRLPQSKGLERRGVPLDDVSSGGTPQRESLSNKVSAPSATSHLNEEFLISNTQVVIQTQEVEHSSTARQKFLPSDAHCVLIVFLVHVVNAVLFR